MIPDYPTWDVIALLALVLALVVVEVSRKDVTS